MAVGLYLASQQSAIKPEAKDDGPKKKPKKDDLVEKIDPAKEFLKKQKAKEQNAASPEKPKTRGAAVLLERDSLGLLRDPATGDNFLDVLKAGRNITLPGDDRIFGLEPIRPYDPQQTAPAPIVGPLRKLALP